MQNLSLNCGNNTFLVAGIHAFQSGFNLGDTSLGSKTYESYDCVIIHLIGAHYSILILDFYHSNRLNRIMGIYRMLTNQLLVEGAILGLENIENKECATS